MTHSIGEDKVDILPLSSSVETQYSLIHLYDIRLLPRIVCHLRVISSHFDLIEEVVRGRVEWDTVYSFRTECFLYFVIVN